MKFYKIISRVFIIIFCTNLFSISANAQSKNNVPLRLAIVGATHGHIPFILGRKGKTDVTVVGIYEPNVDLSKRIAKAYNLSADLFYTDLNKMLNTVKPEAVVAFGSIYQHMAVVEACAPRGIHIMVEKPLATNIEHSKRMEQLAKKYNVFLLTDYETSWYPTTAKVYNLVADSNYVGKIRKVVIHDGHQGPAEINVNKEFLAWLTDPIQNGGGALVDFGCYGADLITYLMHGEEPISVTAVTQHFKPAIYPKVEDEATIIVTYPTTQCIIQASWNWPFSRKDMEVYGDKGYVIAEDNNNMRLRNQNTKGEQTLQVTSKDIPVYTDPFTYFVDVVRGRVKVAKYGLYSLENNLLVVKILDAARASAKSGKTIILKNYTGK